MISHGMAVRSVACQQAAAQHSRQQHSTAASTRTLKTWPGHSVAKMSRNALLLAERPRCTAWLAHGPEQLALVVELRRA